MAIHQAEGPSGKKRLIILSVIAALALIVVGIAIAQQNRENARKSDQLATLGEEPTPDFGYNIGPDGKPINKNSKAPSGSTKDAKGGSSSGRNASGKVVDSGQSQFNMNENNNSTYPVSNSGGSTDPASNKQQATGEQILQDIANGVAGGTTLESLEKALRKAETAFLRSIKNDPNNEAALYGVAYVRVNLSGVYTTTKTKSDDSKTKGLLEAALANAKKAQQLSKGKNETVYELSTELIRGVSAYIADSEDD